jgi:hypothetical protein
MQLTCCANWLTRRVAANYHHLILHITALHSQIYEQGSFDYLCGIYSVLNGLAVMSQDQIDCDQLFAKIIRRIGRQLPTVMLIGMSSSELRNYVLDVAVEHCALQYSVMPRTRSLDQFWSRLTGHVSQHGAGSVLLGIWGTHNHWSCVKKLTERSIMLLDSMRLSRIHRTSITLDRNERRRHLLTPSNTYLLTL